MNEWYTNGQAASHLPLADRGLRYGDGLFETIAIRNGTARLLDLHAIRLSTGLERLGLTGRTADECLQELSLALSATSMDLSRATARLVVTAGSGARGYSRQPDLRHDVYVELCASEPLDDSAYKQGVDTFRCKTRTSWQPALAGLKTLNRLDQVLARREWNDESVFEGLMCDRDEHVICGTMSNVYAVRNNQVFTPSLTSSGVAGVMRRCVIDVAQAAGMRISETNISWVSLSASDEVFLSNSQFGVVPVRRCGANHWTVGPVAHEVRALLARAGVAEGPE